MVDLDIQVYNESFGPLKGVEVDCFNLTGSSILARAISDLNGLAHFKDLPADKNFHFRPKVTRHSMLRGARQEYGAVEISRPVFVSPEKVPEIIYPIVVGAVGSTGETPAFGFGQHVTLDLRAVTDPNGVPIFADAPIQLILVAAWGGQYGITPPLPTFYSTTSDPFSGDPQLTDMGWALMFNDFPRSDAGGEFPIVDAPYTDGTYTPKPNMRVAAWTASMGGLGDVLVTLDFGIFDIVDNGGGTDPLPCAAVLIAVANGRKVSSFTSSPAKLTDTGSVVGFGPTKKNSLLLSFFAGWVSSVLNSGSILNHWTQWQWGADPGRINQSTSSGVSGRPGVQVACVWSAVLNSDDLPRPMQGPRGGNTWLPPLPSQPQVDAYMTLGTRIDPYRPPNPP